jgi:hypothetical protein
MSVVAGAGGMHRVAGSLPTSGKVRDNARLGLSTPVEKNRLQARRLASPASLRHTLVQTMMSHWRTELHASDFLFRVENE